jgi:hypothetical protein
MRKKLRLIMFDECNRACDGCCNNDVNTLSLDVVDGYSEYDLVM